MPVHNDSIVDDDNDQSNTDEQNSIPSKSIKEQCAPLFVALEHGVTTSPDGLLSAQPFVSLFSKRSDRSALLGVIRSSKFHKTHARRLFNALCPIIENVVENEIYIPLSAYDDEVEENSETNDSVQQQSQQATNQESRKQSSTEFCSSCDENPDVITPDERSTQALLFLKYSAMTVHAYLENLLQRRPVVNGLKDQQPSSQRVFSIIEEVWKNAELLHDILFSLHSCGVEGMFVQKAISAMCEKYWNGQFSDREVLVTQLIPYLVVKTLDGNATKADLKRFRDMRYALMLLDFKEESGIAHLKTLLLRTVSSPLYLKHPEGRKMVAFLFQLDCELVSDLHTAIKVQIPLAKRGVLEAYGDIYWNAWKEASSIATGQIAEKLGVEEGDSKTHIRKAIEENALQDLMYSALHVASPHIARSLRILLEPIHSQKKNPEVDQLLYHMYGPILWRALSATNPLVRIHASSIFAEVYPLHDPRAGKNHLKEVTTKSVDTLMSLLNDYDPKVRVAGCDAAVRILGVYWDAVNTRNIRSILNEIIMRHANDVSSAAVRAQAIHGIILLLDAESSHAVLRPLLPLLGNHIHDSAERVRLATVKLLLKLKSLKGIKYYHAVPSNHILARLAAEGDGTRNFKGSVSSALTGLLCNSYFPLGAKGSEQMRRTLFFLSDNSRAARVFYSNLSKHLDVNNICKLIAMLTQTLQFGVKREIEENGSIRNRSSKKRCRRSISDETCDETTGSTEIIADNTSLMAEVTETIHCLWMSIEYQLVKDENEPCLEFLQNTIGGKNLTELFSYFNAKINTNLENETNVSLRRRSECNRICTSLLCCAAKLSPETAVGLSSLLSLHIDAYRKMTEMKKERINICPVFALFCSWGMHQNVADSFSNSILSEFEDNNDSEEVLFNDEADVGILGCTRRNKRKKAALENSVKDASSMIPQLSAEDTINLIDKILSGTDPACISARDDLISSEMACSVIENALEKGTILAERILNGSTSKANVDDKKGELVLSACEVYGKLALHTAVKKNGPLNLSPQFRTLLLWITNRVIPTLLAMKEGEKTSSPFNDINLSRISSSPSALSPLAVPPPRQRSNLNVTPNKLDISFIRMENYGVQRFTESSSILQRQAMGLSLLKSSVIIIAEWLLIGGEGSHEISEYGLKWIKATILLDFKVVDCFSEVLPVFTRLAFVLGRKCLDYELMKEILKIADELKIVEESLDIVKSSLISLVSLHSTGATTHLEKLASIVIELSGGIVPDKPEKEIDSLNDVIPVDLRGLKLAMEIVMSTGQGIAVLARVISERLDSGSQENLKLNGFLNAQFLRFLYDQVPLGKHFEQMKLHNNLELEAA